MAIQKARWFDDETYMENKLAQMQKLIPDYTMAQVESDFAKAGFTSEEGHFRHFLKYGNRPVEDISPNDFFNPEEYYRYKAQQYYKLDSVHDVTDSQALAMETAIKNAGMSAWTHYIRYGTKEGINPSSLFDTNEYIEAKLKALYDAGIHDKSGHNYTRESLLKVFKDANINALEHAMQYGTTASAHKAGEVIFWSDESHSQILPTFEYTEELGYPKISMQTGIENIQGTNGDDKIIGVVTKTTDYDIGLGNVSTYKNMGTFTVGDTITDNSGNDNDVLKLVFTAPETDVFSDTVSVKNIERIIVENDTDATLTFSCRSIENVKTLEAVLQGKTPGLGDDKIFFQGITSYATKVSMTGHGNLEASWEKTNDPTAQLVMHDFGLDENNTADFFCMNGKDAVKKLVIETSGTNYAETTENVTKVTVKGSGTNYFDFEHASTKATELEIDARETTHSQTFKLPDTHPHMKVYGGSDDDLFILDGTMYTTDSLHGGNGHDMLIVRQANDLSYSTLRDANAGIEIILSGNIDAYENYALNQGTHGIMHGSNIFLDKSCWTVKSQQNSVTTFTQNENGGTTQLQTTLSVAEGTLGDQECYVLGDKEDIVHLIGTSDFAEVQL